MERVSIILVNYKNPKDTLELLMELRHLTYENYEVVLVDNGADINREDLFRNILPKVNFVRSIENLGFAGGVNLGVSHAKGNLILLLNNDTNVNPSFLEPMVDLIQSDSKIGMVSPRIIFADGSEKLQYAGASTIHPILGRGRKVGYGEQDDLKFHSVHETGLGNGACMLIKRKVLQDVGGVPEDYFMYYEEHDMCQRAKKFGWKTFYCGATYIHHKQSMSLGAGSPIKTYYLHRNRVLYMKRFTSGIQRIAFLVYYSTICLPQSLIKRIANKQWSHAAQIIKAYRWNLTH